MDGYKHLSIEEREDIMVRWKDHEGVSQIARELGRDKSTASREIGRNGWRGPSGRVYRASTAQGRSRRAAATLQAPQAHERPGEARPGRGADEERVLVPGADIRPQRDGAAGPGRERREHLPSRAVGGGDLDCELPGHRKASELLRHHGKRRREKGLRERRGKEFSDAEGLQGAPGPPSTSTVPKRGTNENANGLLRDWFPKGTSLNDVTDDAVQLVYDLLNRRPRKRPG
jgi:IS30 family transposase